MPFKHVVSINDFSNEEIAHVSEIAGKVVPIAEIEVDDELFEENIARLTDALCEQTEAADELNMIIRANQEDIGYGL